MYKKRIKCYHLVKRQIQKMMTFIVALSAPLVHQVTIILFRAHSFTSLEVDIGQDIVLTGFYQLASALIF